MRTFKALIKGAALVALSGVLLGCVEGPATLGPTPIPKAVSVTAGGTPIVIAAPNGFCVDRATVDENGRGAFMFLSDCYVIDAAGTTARVPISAILTASISPTGLVGSEQGVAPALTSLKEFLASPLGLFTLGKSNVDGAVSILSAKQSDVALYLLVQDTAFTDDVGASNRYWRAFTEVNGRLVALSVTGYARNDSMEERSLRIIRAFVEAIVNANAPAS